MHPPVTRYSRGANLVGQRTKADAATDYTDFDFGFREIRVICGLFFCFLCLLPWSGPRRLTGYILPEAVILMAGLGSCDVRHEKWIRFETIPISSPSPTHVPGNARC